MNSFTIQMLNVAKKPLLVLTTLLAISGIDRHVWAQSIRIQSWNAHHGSPIGGISIGGPLVVPHGYGHYDHHHGYAGSLYSGFRYPGLGYGFGVPYQSFSLSFGSPYGNAPYPYQNDYFDYRSDYNRRLYDSYQRGLQQNLYDSSLGLDFGGLHAFGLNADAYAPFYDRSYRPPVAQIEPFGTAETFGLQPYADVPAPTPSASLPEALKASAIRLSNSLSRRRDDSDVWLNYLEPGRIVSTIDQGLPAQSISGLLKNFDGVVGNPELRSVAATDGFEFTRRLLHQWLEAESTTEPDPTEATAPNLNEEVAPSQEDVPIEAARVPNRRSV